MRLHALLLGAAVLSLSACGPTTKYNWGNYSQSLYDYQADATEKDDYTKALALVIKQEGPSKKVPPGLFAEYGYMKLADGDTAGAIELFEREKNAWPESAVMMDKAIASAKAGGPAKAAPATGTPSASSSTPVS